MNYFIAVSAYSHTASKFSGITCVRAVSKYIPTTPKFSGITYVRAVSKYSATASKFSGNAYVRAVSKYSPSASTYSGITYIRAVPKYSPHLLQNMLFLSTTAVDCTNTASNTTLCQHHCHERTHNRQVPDTFGAHYDASLVITTHRQQAGHGCSIALPSFLCEYLMIKQNHSRGTYWDHLFLQPNQHIGPLCTQSKLCYSCTTKHNTECITTPPSTMCFSAPPAYLNCWSQSRSTHWVTKFREGHVVEVGAEMVEVLPGE